MVNDSGQLYTLEGLAAGILMILTAYLVMNTTTILTPGDMHVNDLQLAQLGNDVLRMMDTPDAYNVNNVANWIAINDLPSKTSFTNQFLSYWPDRAQGMPDSVKFNAKVYHQHSLTPGSSDSYEFCEYPVGTEYLRENAVTVSRWVTVDNSLGTNTELDSRNQVVLLEVLLWRD